MIRWPSWRRSSIKWCIGQLLTAKVFGNVYKECTYTKDGRH